MILNCSRALELWSSRALELWSFREKPPLFKGELLKLKIEPPWLKDEPPWQR
jgi:hypothetical protein